MFVIVHNGQAITGWRAWLLGIVAFVVTAVVLVAVGFIVLSITITLATALLFIVPLVVAFAFIASLLRTRGPDRPSAPR
jgi:hypothetical protein